MQNLEEILKQAEGKTIKSIKEIKGEYKNGLIIELVDAETITIYAKPTNDDYVYFETE